MWGGSTLESKRQNMRDAMKFHDEPPYYEDGGLRLVSYDLDQMPVRLFLHDTWVPSYSMTPATMCTLMCAPPGLWLSCASGVVYTAHWSSLVRTCDSFRVSFRVSTLPATMIVGVREGTSRARGLYQANAFLSARVIASGPRACWLPASCPRAPQTPEGFNSWPLERTEDMIRFHVRSANHQLRQTYFAFAAALVLNRTLVMPRVSSTRPNPMNTGTAADLDGVQRMPSHGADTCLHAAKRRNGGTCTLLTEHSARSHDPRPWPFLIWQPC